MSEHVQSIHGDAVATIVLSRPEAGNRLTNAMAAALALQYGATLLSNVLASR